MKTKILILFIGLFTALSCTDEFFEAKSDRSLVIPASIADLQAMVNNTGFYEFFPSLSVIGVDDYYVFTEVWQSLTGIPPNSYVWAADPYQGANVNDWNLRYRQILVTNTVLEEIEKITPSASELNEWKSVKGQAMFHRAYNYYSLSQIFTLPYNIENASANLGLPLRLQSDIEAQVPRSSLQQTYDQILADLTGALPLLPAHEIPNNTVGKFRPSKCTGYALLSRIHLSIENYDLAGKYADSCLALYDVLIDYNSIANSTTYPIPQLNAEVLLHATLSNSSLNSPVTRNRVDTMLYAMYEENDLRKVLFFQPQAIGHTFRGSYNGSLSFFSGLATDEIFLNRAESRARLGDVAGAMADINTLLVNRYEENTYIPKTANSSSEALDIVLAERRKELLTRGLRWSDLRRLNQDPARATTVVRKLGDDVYELPPNDNRYAWPIPDYEIEISGIEQNSRN